MLEQNTDRSYFMIGAVIIAAILIAGATYIFRDVLFFNNDAVIPTMMENIFGQANDMVTNIDNNSGLKK
ncbi:hypothetical protein RKD55_004731 [Rossellomorea marisflavi]